MYRKKYYCHICNSNHYYDSEKGKKHLGKMTKEQKELLELFTYTMSELSGRHMSKKDKLSLIERTKEALKNNEFKKTQLLENNKKKDKRKKEWIARHKAIIKYSKYPQKRLNSIKELRKEGIEFDERESQ